MAKGCFGVGRAEGTADNGAGAAGAVSLTYRTGQFCFANLAGDLVTQAEVGKVRHLADDQTVAKTSGGATRSPAGIAEGLEASGAVPSPLR